MMRSAIASTALASAPVKKTHGPGRAGTGGSPAFGAHGSWPCTTAARLANPVRRRSAVPANNSRRRKPTRMAGSSFMRCSLKHQTGGDVGATQLQGKMALGRCPKNWALGTFIPQAGQAPQTASDRPRHPAAVEQIERTEKDQ